MVISALEAGRDDRDSDTFAHPDDRVAMTVLLLLVVMEMMAATLMDVRLMVAVVVVKRKRV